MDRAGHDLLARAALAREPDRRVDRRHLADRGEHLLHAWARPEHPLEAADGGRWRSSRFSASSAWSRSARRNTTLSSSTSIGFTKKSYPPCSTARSACARSPRPVITTTLAAASSDAQLVERGEALLDATRVRRQAEVERHDDRMLRAGALERCFSVAGEHDVELVGERPPHLRAQVLVVVDHEQLGF